jgi:hypothetical protein
MEPDRATALRAAERPAVSLHAVAIAWVANMPEGYWTRSRLIRAMAEKFPKEGKERCRTAVGDCIAGRAIRWAARGEVVPYRRTRRMVMGTGLVEDATRARTSRELARLAQEAQATGHVSPDRDSGRLHGVTHW